MMRKILFFVSISVLLWPALVPAQYAPPAGQPGSTAIHKDSAVFVAWATDCHVSRGYQNIADTSLGLATVGDSSAATGQAGSNGVVSLGDGGTATLTFDYPLVNGTGWDFAVFENGFGDFLELAFVEVSSDGELFFRFPAHSLTDTSGQTDGFGGTDATKINNLAGKYTVLYGTPFDLEEMKNLPGLDVNRITHVRIIDVVGSLQKEYAAFDTAGNKINDPWPTPFDAGGFDLDAVGILWNQANSLQDAMQPTTLKIFPNPGSQLISLEWPLDQGLATINVRTIHGKCIETLMFTGQSGVSLDVSKWPQGCYSITITNGKITAHETFIKL